MSAAWSREQSDLATIEGWDVFNAEGSSLNENGDRPYQLQRWDEVDLFDSDEDAMKHVRRRADEGSELHMAALAYLKAESRPEYDEIMGLVL